METGKLELTLNLVDPLPDKTGRFLKVEGKNYQVKVESSGKYESTALREAVLPHLYEVAKVRIITQRKYDGEFPNHVEVTIQDTD